jgi:hypothetical protein
MVVEFASVVDAVPCTVEVQQAMPERDTSDSADTAIPNRKRPVDTWSRDATSFAVCIVSRWRTKQIAVPSLTRLVIRFPSSACEPTGLKPTWGRVTHGHRQLGGAPTALALRQRGG